MMDKQEKLYFVYAEGENNPNYKHHFVIKTADEPLEAARKVFSGHFFGLPADKYNFELYELEAFPFIFD